MTTKTNPLPPLLSDEQIERTFQHHGGNWDGSVWIIEDADLHPFARDLSQQAVREALAAQPAPAGLTDEQIATMRSDAWLVFNASEAPQEVRDVIEWYDGTLRAALTQEGSTTTQPNKAAEALIDMLLAEANKADDVHADLMRAAAEALATHPKAEPAGVPEGWQLVPKEPTPEMMRAAVIYANGKAVYKIVAAEALAIEESIYGEMWAAMISAAPQGKEANRG